MNKYILFVIILLSSSIHFQQTKVKVFKYQYDIIQLVNEQRAKGCKCGSKKFSPLPPIAWSAQLEEAAKIQANYMSKKDILTHQGEDGKDLKSRLSRVKYIWRAYSENIADGYESTQEVFEAWMASPGHCKNIMGDYKEMGVYKVNEFWVQDFGTPKI
ncbi:MAG: CAP domain-containing protein [Saprospiraceae bacterium]|nr:CAP domain-containing protein [Saprospiraceae bacterium]